MNKFFITLSLLAAIAFLAIPRREAPVAQAVPVEVGYQATLGKCINITDPAERKSCSKQAAADLADALDTCKRGLECGGRVARSLDRSVMTP